MVEGGHADPVQRGRQHQITNLVVSPDREGREDDRRAQTYFIVTDAENAPPSELVFSAYSDDVVVKVDGQWRFRYRSVGVWGADAVDQLAAERS